MRPSPASADNLSIYFCCLSVNRAGDASAVSGRFRAPAPSLPDARPILGQPPRWGLFFCPFPGRQRGLARLLRIQPTKKKQIFQIVFSFFALFSVYFRLTLFFSLYRPYLPFSGPVAAKCFRTFYSVSSKQAGGPIRPRLPVVSPRLPANTSA